MKLYYCSVRLADSAQHIVPNKVVTIPEIAVLKAVHGENAVTDIRPIKDVPDIDPKTKKQKVDVDTGEPLWVSRGSIERSDDEERERLAKRYDNAVPGEESAIVARLFPKFSPLPQALRSIGIDPQAAAAEMRRKAEELSASAALLSDSEPADEPEEDVDGMFDEDPGAKKTKAA